MAGQEREARETLVDDLIAWLRDYAKKRINSSVIDERRCIPPPIVLDFGRVGLMGMQTAKQYGGLALGYRDSKRVSSQMAAIDLTLATFVGIHNFLGIRPLEAFGSEVAKQAYLPLLAQGRMLGGLAITEVGAGSNPRALVTSARRVSEGWLLNGRKIWIGNGSWAGALNVFARVTPSPGIAGGVLACVVPTTSRGFGNGLEAPTMGMRGVVQNEIVLDDVLVPDQQVLGKAGDGFRVAEDSFMRARLGIAFMSIGGMRRALQLAWRYASGRSVATGKLSENALSRRRFGWLVCATEALDALAEQLARDLDAAESPPPAAFLACKILGPELLGRAVDASIQFLGGRGYIETNCLPQLYRDARLLRIFEGPTETMASHLGWMALNGPAQLNRYIAEHLGQPAMALRLSEALELAREQTDPASEDEVCYAAGTAAAYALLAACTAHRGAGQEANPQIALWTEMELERQLQRLLRPRPAACASAWLAERIESYAHVIGDFNQSLPGMDQALDPLLREAAH